MKLKLKLKFTDSKFDFSTIIDVENLQDAENKLIGTYINVGDSFHENFMKCVGVELVEMK